MISDTGGSNALEHNGGVKTYLLGFLASIFLTIIPFWVVMAKPLSPILTLITVLVMAVFQILVHLVCFLHMSTRSNDGWNLIAFVFTGLIITILVVGSVWIMWNLNYNMMVT